MPEYRDIFLRLHQKLRHLSMQPAAKSTTPSPSPMADETPFSTGLEVSISLGRKTKARELVVISGKGGTGKTSLSASFFCLAKQAAVADCDVDAADLHLLLNPHIRVEQPFQGGMVATIEADRCTSCGICAEHCRFDAIEVVNDGPYRIKPIGCEGCGVCALVCPEDAIRMVPETNGTWFISETAWGPMVHARLGIAQENSGKLVSLVRKEAKSQTTRHGRGLLICDGSPGIGCPVIASVTGADFVLVVTEPTLSGLHDLERVVELTKQFRLEAGVCINKADINPEVSDAIEKRAKELGIEVLGRIRYDDVVTQAQVDRMSVVQKMVDGQTGAASDIRALWKRLETLVLG